MRTLGIIPARGGSQGIPRKNVSLLAGKPLICYTIDAALRARTLQRVIVSTDDIEIAEVARDTGAEVPFMRPAELASDDASPVDVAIHAIHALEAADPNVYDAVVLLQPTSPFRVHEDIDGAVSLLETTDADSVVSFSPVAQEGHPYYLYILEEGHPKPLLSVPSEMMRRQEFPPIYVRNGAIYAVRREVLLEQRSWYGPRTRAYLMPTERSLNIDTPFDLKLAEGVLAMSPASQPRALRP